jgi:hypothetical protein
MTLRRFPPARYVPIYHWHSLLSRMEPSTGADDQPLFRGMPVYGVHAQAILAQCWIPEQLLN